MDGIPLADIQRENCTEDIFSTIFHASFVRNKIIHKPSPNFNF